MKITGADSNILYDPDDDHIDLEIWDHIKCECDPNCDNNSTLYQERDELIMMRKCGNSLYSAYLRQNDWKLVVNGSNYINDNCPIPPV